VILETCILGGVVSDGVGYTNIENGIEILLSIASLCVPMPDGTKSRVLGVCFINMLRDYLMKNLSCQALEELGKINMDIESESEVYYRRLEFLCNAVHAAYYLYTLRNKRVTLSLGTKHFAVVLERIFRTLNEIIVQREKYDREMRECREKTPSGYRKEYHREGLMAFNLQLDFCGTLLNDFFVKSRDNLAKDPTELENGGTLYTYYERYASALENPASPMFTDKSRDEGCRMLGLELEYSSDDDE
jgi:hypothetical protein